MSAAAFARQVGNLPADVTSFVGRRCELAEVRRLLSTSRLVTLTGVGGVGKTRLALRAAAASRRSFNAIWLVDLAGLTDPALVVQTVAVAVGLRNGATRHPVAALGDFLARGRVLLVLDNCEHLLDACAELADALLRVAPDLRILATSRQSLGIPGESVMPVQPLSVPESDEPATAKALEQYDAVNLFADRAAAVSHGFVIDEENRKAVARLCRQLEGIPLAIELAAVRLRALSVEGIVERLDDRYRWLTGGSRVAMPRQRTLRALIDWSYRLLPPAERALWVRLSVFAGNFDLEAVEAVCTDGEVAADDVLDLLNALIDKSLLSASNRDGQARYRMLETLRQFGAEELDPVERAALRSRHRDWYLRTVDQAADEWFGPGQAAWAARLRFQQPNLRAALEFCATEPGEAETGLRMAARLLQPHWLANSFFDEGRYWLDRLLQAVPDSFEYRAKALYADAWLALMQGDPATALSMLERAQPIAERANDQESLAWASYLFGLAALFSGDLRTALERLGDALARHTANHDLLGITMSSLSLGRCLRRRGDPERAAELYESALRLTAEHNESWCRHWVLTVLAMEAWERGELRRASGLARESLLLDRQELDDRHNMASDIEVLAWIALDEGDPRRAARLIGAADTVARTVGVSFLPVVGEKHHNRCAERLREQLGDKAFIRAVEAGQRMNVEQALDEALGRRIAAPEPKPAAGTRSPLTPRETEIAELVAEGMSNREIAERLVIAQRTAEGHVEHILSKLGFTSRTQIAAWVAERQGAVTDRAEPAVHRRFRRIGE